MSALGLLKPMMVTFLPAKNLLESFRHSIPQGSSTKGAPAGTTHLVELPQADRPIIKSLYRRVTRLLAKPESVRWPPSLQRPPYRRNSRTLV